MYTQYMRFHMGPGPGIGDVEQMNLCMIMYMYTVVYHAC